jgi:Flp pilus assembly protein TadG
MTMTVSKFLTNNRGNVAIFFSLALLPIIMAGGVAVDYIRAGRIKGDLQKATDTAALAIAAQSGGIDQAAAKKIGEQYLNANFSDDEKSLDSINIERKTGSVLVQATANVRTSMLGVFRIYSVPVSAEATGAWGTDKIEIALALDNTGSMGSKGKLPALKSAVKNLLSTLEASATQPDTFRVAVVPFATQVNVGASNRDASWLYMDGVLPESFAGCVADRDQPEDTKNNKPARDKSRNPLNFPAVPCLSNVAPAQALTSDYAALRTTVDSMVASGNTNVTIGLNWAHLALTPDSPLPGAQPFNTKGVIKIAILLTDGDNTQNRWTNKTSDIDKRTEKACDEVKSSGVRLYTIRVIDGNASLLKKCATSPAHFYEVKDASELDPVFKSLAREITAVRLSK